MSCACILSSGNEVVDLPKGLKPRFLRGLSKAERDSILSVAKHLQFRASSMPINQEDPAERFFLLTSGHGRQFVVTNDGRKILLQWLTAGQIFGGSALLSSPFQYLASTEVLTDSCALVWGRLAIRELAFQLSSTFGQCAINCRHGEHRVVDRRATPCAIYRAIGAGELSNGQAEYEAEQRRREEELAWCSVSALAIWHQPRASPNGETSVLPTI